MQLQLPAYLLLLLLYIMHVQVTPLDNLETRGKQTAFNSMQFMYEFIKPNNHLSRGPMAQLRLRQLFVVNWPVVCVYHMWVFVNHVVDVQV